MIPTFFQRLLSRFRPTPSPRTIAAQLRQPSGLLAKQVGERMNQSNEPLYDFTLSKMALRDGDSVLEVGFGNGNFFEKVFSQAGDLQVSGLDFSPDMVKEAGKNNQTLVDSGALRLALGSSDRMPFADNSFDKVFCINVIYFWENPAAHLQEINRVLKPDGQFYATIRTRESMLTMPFTQYGFRLHDAEEWKAILEKNGFSVTSVESLSEPPVEVNNSWLQLESLCLIALKNSRHLPHQNNPSSTGSG